MKQIVFIISLVQLLAIVPLTEVGASTSLTYQYDANGNLTQGDGKYFEYNDFNQLVSVRHGDANGPVIAQYFYDHQGQRVKKIEQGVVTYYIGKHYVSQVDGNTVTNTNYYFANGQRVAKKDSSGNLSYYLSDHLGGTNAVVDSSGNLVERTNYFPFGDIRQGGTDRFTYTGKEKDKFTDSFYFEARYYNSGLKHFSQSDTVAPDTYNAQNWNKYSYVTNNPTNLLDPDGHAAIGSNKWMHELIRAQQYDKGKYLRLMAAFERKEMRRAIRAIPKLPYAMATASFGPPKKGVVVYSPTNSNVGPYQSNSGLASAQRAYADQIRQRDSADVAYDDAYAKGLEPATKLFSGIATAANDVEEAFGIVDAIIEKGAQETGSAMNMAHEDAPHNPIFGWLEANVPLGGLIFDTPSAQ